jgi:hypothetical protein
MALQFHLKQPILGMDEAEPKREVIVVLGGDRRYAIGVARDRHLAVQTRDGDPTVGLW